MRRQKVSPLLWAALGGVVLLYLLRAKVAAIVPAIAQQLDPVRRQLSRVEGRKNYVYQDSRGLDTFGVGHLLRPGEENLKQYTPENPAPDSLVDEYLDADSAAAKAAVQAIGVPLNDNQFAALVSFAFNIGNAGFAASTVARKLKALDYAGAADAMLMWNKPPEIMGRRNQERELFLA